MGISSGNRPRTLRLEAKKDGVHGMVAGGTGSGKSELLMTLIVGLALNYPIRAFSTSCWWITRAAARSSRSRNCRTASTSSPTSTTRRCERMFTAISAEMRRRQALNADTGTKDIVEYRAKGLHLTREPYPHLFIIIDEYAEMIDRHAEYLRQLESITRVGRAQGVNLILASQRPKGVTDQMRANIKLGSACASSRSTPAARCCAAPTPHCCPMACPGAATSRSAMRIWSSSRWPTPARTQPDDRAAGILWPDRPARTAADEEPPKLFDMAVKIASELVHGARTPKPWPAFLPERFSLESPLVDAQRSAIYTLTTTITDWINGDTSDLWPRIDWRPGVAARRRPGG